MFISSMTPGPVLATATLANTIRDVPAANNTSDTSDTTNTTNISTDNSTNSSGMNALTMFLFWFFIISTILLVLGSLAVLRRLKRRDKNIVQQQKALESVQAAKGFFGVDPEAGNARHSVSGRDNGHEESLGGTTISLLPLAKSHSRLV